MVWELAPERKRHRDAARGSVREARPSRSAWGGGALYNPFRVSAAFFFGRALQINIITAGILAALKTLRAQRGQLLLTELIACRAKGGVSAGAPYSRRVLAQGGPGTIDSGDIICGTRTSFRAERIRPMESCNDYTARLRALQVPFAFIFFYHKQSFGDRGGPRDQRPHL